MLRTLRTTEWSHLRDYVSGAFFEVLPASLLAAEVAKLSRNLARRRAFEQARAHVASRWAGLEPTVALVDRLPGPALVDGVDPSVREQIGHRVLVAFFRVVLGGGDVMLDLRPTRWSWTGQALAWAPGRLWTTWAPAFGEQVAELYAGFYADDDAGFRAALSALGLSAAEGPMRAHFGLDDQRAVAFRLERFHETFHDVFVACRDAGGSLDPGFVSLGLALATLYETMEVLGGAFDVRAAWEAAAQ